MKLKLLTLLITLGVINSTLFAQNKIIPLKKGDIVPADLPLGKMINYRSKTAKISDFKGKLIILDFWNTHCPPCVRGLPRMDSLQKQFGNKIAIIPITRNELPEIQTYFKKKKFQLPSVVEDSILSKVFPQLALDMHVWINEKGKIIITTDGDEVNSKTISQYFKTGKLDVKERIDWDTKALLLKQDNIKEDDFLGYSLLRKSKGGGAIMADYYWDTSGPGIPFHKYLSVRGFDFLGLYNIVLCMMRSNYKRGECTVAITNPNWFIIETGGRAFSPLNYWEERDDPRDSIMNWLAGAKYDYDFKVPSPGIKSDSTFYRKYMLEDLNRLSPYYGKIEKRKVQSWVIIKKDNSSSFLATSSQGIQNYNVVFHDNFTRDRLEKVENVALDDFIKGFMYSSYAMMPPVFNDTGYDKEKISLNDLNIDVEANKGKAFYSKVDLEEWRAAFQRNGLDIKVEDREVEVMVFRKKETPTK